MDGMNYIFNDLFPYMEDNVNDFSDDVSQAFLNGFKYCSDTGCITSSFCSNFVEEFDLNNYGNDLVDQIDKRFSAQAGRFQRSIISGEDLEDVCDFSEDFINDGADCGDLI